MKGPLGYHPERPWFKIRNGRDPSLEHKCRRADQSRASFCRRSSVNIDLRAHRVAASGLQRAFGREPSLNEIAATIETISRSTAHALKRVSVLSPDRSLLPTAPAISLRRSRPSCGTELSGELC